MPLKVFLQPLNGCHVWQNIPAQCQSMTLHTELCTPPNISKALPCSLTHCVADSTACATPILPPPSTLPHAPCLVVCLFVSLSHSPMRCLPCFFISSPCFSPSSHAPT